MWRRIREFFGDPRVQGVLVTAAVALVELLKNDAETKTQETRR